MYIAVLCAQSHALFPSFGSEGGSAEETCGQFRASAGRAQAGACSIVVMRA